MKIEPGDATQIGQRFVKSFWTHCYFKVEDVGVHSVWGYIIDRQSERRVEMGIFPLTDEWIEYDDAHAMIRRLPLKEN